VLGERARFSNRLPSSRRTETIRDFGYIGDLYSAVDDFDFESMEDEGDWIDIQSYMEELGQSEHRMFRLNLSRGEYGNAHSGRVTVFPSIDLSEESYLNNAGRMRLKPAPFNAIGGCQLYTSDSRDFLMRQVRPELQSSVVKLIPMIRNLFSPHPDPSYVAPDNEKRIRILLQDINEVFQNVIVQSRFQSRNPVRFEQFFVTEDIHNDTELTWATPSGQSATSLYLSDAVQVVDQAETYRFAKKIRETCLEPIQQVFGQVTDPPRDYSVLESASMTALMSHAESIVLYMGSMYTLGVMHREYAQVLRRGIPLQAPRRLRVRISPHQMEMTGLEWGVQPHVYPTGAVYAHRSNNVSQLESIAQSGISMKGICRCPMAYLVSESNIQKIIQKYASHLNGVVDDDPDAQRRGLFEVPNYANLATLPGNVAREMMIELAEELLELYDRDWKNLINTKIKRKRSGNTDRWLLVDFVDDIPQCLEQLPSYENRGFFFPAAADQVQVGEGMISSSDQRTITTVCK